MLVCEPSVYLLLCCVILCLSYLIYGFLLIKHNLTVRVGTKQLPATAAKLFRNRNHHAIETALQLVVVFFHHDH
jgi:hypothetical protein